MVLDSIKIGYHYVSDTTLCLRLQVYKIRGGVRLKDKRLKLYKTYTVGSLRRR
jgi:hypothetical protein